MLCQGSSYSQTSEFEAGTKKHETKNIKLMKWYAQNTKLMKRWAHEFQYNLVCILSEISIIRILKNCRSSAQLFFFFYGATTLTRVLAFPTIAVLYLFCPLHKLHLLHIIPEITFPSILRPSCWSSCEWFPFVYSIYYDSFRHSIYVSKPTQSLGFNIIYCSGV